MRRRPDHQRQLHRRRCRHRHLDQQARRLGFADLRACLQALLDDGWSIPRLATHLDITKPAIRRAIADHQLQQLPRRQRQRAAQQHAAQQRAAELGSDEVRAYLVDRLATQGWTLAEVATELGAAPATLRRLLDRYQVRRVVPTRRQRATAAAASGPTTQARAVQQRRHERLAELGFRELGDHLQDRYVRRGWSMRRLCAELGVGHSWLDRQLTRLGLRP